MRTRIIDYLFTKMEEDEDIFFLTADFGINLVERFQEAFPSRFINVGIAEQNLIGVSAGLCNLGYRPFVYTISNFLIHRCYEQIRNDIAMHNYPVTLLGTSAGFDNAPLGPTHHIIDDWGALRVIPGIDIYCPSSSAEADQVLDRIIVREKPAYVRIPKGSFEEPDLGGDTVYLRAKTNEHVLLISYGSSVQNCLKVRARRDDVSVLVCNQLRPLSEQVVLEALSSHSRTIVVEDHFPSSGLYGMLCQLLVKHRMNVDLDSLAPDEDYVLRIGSSPAYYAELYGMTAEAIEAAILSSSRAKEGSAAPSG